MHSHAERGNEKEVVVYCAHQKGALGAHGAPYESGKVWINSRGGYYKSLESPGTCRFHINESRGNFHRKSYCRSSI